MIEKLKDWWQDYRTNPTYFEKFCTALLFIAVLVGSVGGAFALHWIFGAVVCAAWVSAAYATTD